MSKNLRLLIECIYFLLNFQNISPTESDLNNHIAKILINLVTYENVSLHRIMDHQLLFVFVELGVSGSASPLQTFELALSGKTPEDSATHVMTPCSSANSSCLFGQIPNSDKNQHRILGASTLIIEHLLQYISKYLGK